MSIIIEEFAILDCTYVHPILYENRLYILNISIIRNSANAVDIYSAFVGLDNKVYKIGGMYIKILA